MGTHVQESSGHEKEAKYLVQLMNWWAGAYIYLCQKEKRLLMKQTVRFQSQTWVANFETNLNIVQVFIRSHKHGTSDLNPW